MPSWAGRFAPPSPHLHALARTHSPQVRSVEDAFEELTAGEAISGYRPQVRGGARSAQADRVSRELQLLADPINSQQQHVAAHALTQPHYPLPRPPAPPRPQDHSPPQEATKTVRLQRLPPLLCLFLMRFDPANLRQKIT